MHPNDTPPTPVKFTFDGDHLDVVSTNDGEHWAALSTLCAPFNLDTDGQRRKLVALPWATTKIILVVAADRKKRDVFCLNIRGVAGWLFTMNAGKVAPHLRDKLIRYQQECAEVLADHFLGARGVGVAARAAGEEIAKLRRERAVLAAKVELYENQDSPGVIGKHRATVFLLSCLREAARAICAADDDPSDAAFRRTFKDVENQLRLHVGYPASTAQSWANLPLDKFGPAMDKAMEILARAKRDKRRADASRGNGQRKLLDIN